jgi:hypothetical protein
MMTARIPWELPDTHSISPGGEGGVGGRRGGLFPWDILSLVNQSGNLASEPLLSTKLTGGGFNLLSAALVEYDAIPSFWRERRMCEKSKYGAKKILRKKKKEKNLEQAIDKKPEECTPALFSWRQ